VNLLIQARCTSWYAGALSACSVCMPCQCCARERPHTNTEDSALPPHASAATCDDPTHDGPGAGCGAYARGTWLGRVRVGAIVGVKGKGETWKWSAVIHSSRESRRSPGFSTALVTVSSGARRRRPSGAERLALRLVVQVRFGICRPLQECQRPRLPHLLQLLSRSNEQRPRVAQRAVAPFVRSPPAPPHIPRHK
jgi:hypothetical protein